MSEGSSSTQLVPEIVEEEKPVPKSTLPCEMCQNYELNLTIMQNSERKLTEELKSSQNLIERYESDLSTERSYRLDMERNVVEIAAKTTAQVNEAVKVNQQLEMRLSELTAKHEKAVEVFTEQLNLSQKTIEEIEGDHRKTLEKYQNLLGANKKSAYEMRSEPIELPSELDQLQFLCLQSKEELIEVKAAKEHVERDLKDEIDMIREQLKNERGARQGIERELHAQINTLQTELGIANSKLSAVATTLAQSETFSRQIRDLQTTISELEAQVTQVQNERAAVELTAQNYKIRCSSLQHELDESEVVQRDFVKLSQSLQIQLEKIRQSEQEVRWQFDDDVDKCTNCETSVVRLRPKPHCLHCGKIFCIPCTKATVLSGPNRRLANVCQVCHTLLNPSSKPFFATDDKK